MRNTIQKTYCIILCLIMIFPALGLFYTINFTETCENRTLKEFPKFNISKSFSNDFETYFKDHFTLRNTIINLNSLIKYYVFNSSSKPENAMIGNDGWIFYTSKTDKEIQSFSHTNLFTEDELNENVKNWIAQKSALTNQNIEYYMAVWPSKSTIYNHFIPFRLQAQQSQEISKLDQVLNYLKEKNSPIQILDVRKKLKEKSISEKIYHQTDTHWNSLGAFYAYQELMPMMNIQPYSKDDFIIKSQDYSGDLINLMGVCSPNIISEKQPVFEFKNSKIKIEIAETKLSNTVLVVNNNPELKNKILVFRDSYTSAMIEFISLHFKESYFVWSDYNQDIVDKIKPEKVLVAKVERYF